MSRLTPDYVERNILYTRSLNSSPRAKPTPPPRIMCLTGGKRKGESLSFSPGTGFTRGPPTLLRGKPKKKKTGGKPLTKSRGKKPGIRGKENPSLGAVLGLKENI